MNTISRRGFIAGAGAAALGTAACASAAFADESAAVAVNDAMPAAWDYECDVLVLGAGGSGLAAAWSAANEGADVIALESQGASSASTTYYCFGNYIVCGSDEQAEMGIEDKPEYVLEDVINNGNTEVTPTEETLITPDLILRYAAATRETYDILKGWGLDFSAISDQTGNTTMRCHQIDNRHMVDLLNEHAVEAGVNIMYNTRMTQLVVDGNGMVLGAKATDADGNEIAVKGKKATVLATGPLVRNVALMENALPGASKVSALGGPGANGDGHIAALKLGGALWGQNAIYVCEHYLPTGEMIGTELNQYGAISVNRDGNRFYNDGSHWNNKRTRLLLEEGVNPDTGTYFSWSIIDQKMYDDALHNGNPFHGLSEQKLPYLTEGATIEELAEKIGAPDLPATVAKYNEDLANGGDTVWGRVYKNGPGTGDPIPLDTPPFYAWPTKPDFYFTPCYSFMANEDMQILDVYGDPIGGGRLFGAGELVTRSITGNEYLVGASISFGATMGMQVGKQAAALEAWDA